MTRLAEAFAARTWTARHYFAAGGLVLLLVLSFLPAVDALAQRYLDEGLQRAFVSFATARTLHGLVSVLQGTEIALQPMGFGVTLTPGQLLAPISDLLAQVADWMLLATVAFGLQKLLLAIGGHWLVATVVALVAGAWIICQRLGRAPPWLARMLVVLLFVRLVMPVVTIGSEWMFDQFARPTYEASQTAMDGAASEIASHAAAAETLADDKPAPAPSDGAAAEGAEAEGAEAEGAEAEGAATAQPGAWQRLKDAVRSAGTGVAGAVGSARELATQPQEVARKQFHALQQRLEGMVRHAVMLIVVFVLQTLVLPLLLVWLLVHLNRGLIASVSAPAPPRGHPA